MMTFAVSLWVLGLLLQTLNVSSQDGPGCVCFEELTEARGFISPTVFRNARDGSDRMFIGEHHGLVHIFYPDGVKLTPVFLNLTVYIGGT